MELPNQDLLTRVEGITRLYYAPLADKFESHIGFPIVLPAYFLSDGLSIPKFARSLLAKDPYYINAGRLHDWLYRIGVLDLMARKEADKLFIYYVHLYMIDKSNGIIEGAKGKGWRARTKARSKYLLKRSIDAATKQAIYRAVRLGGWASYKKEKPRFA